MEISGQSSIAIIRLQGNIELNTVLSTGFTWCVQILASKGEKARVHSTPLTPLTSLLLATLLDFFFLEIFDIRAKDKVEFDLKKEVIFFENRTK